MEPDPEPDPDWTGLDRIGPEWTGSLTGPDRVKSSRIKD